MLLCPVPVFSASLPDVTTYDQLIAAIRESWAATSQRIDTAINAERVRQAWETGKLIDEHVYHHKEYMDGGKLIMIRLAGDLGLSYSEVYRMLKFARLYRERPQLDLTWGHYRVLIAVADPVERERLTKEAIEKDWSVESLRDATHGVTRDEIPEVYTEPVKGTLNVYRVVDQQGKLKLDLGFGLFYDLPEAALGKVGAGDFFLVKPKGLLDAKKAKPSEVKVMTDDDLHTYRAVVTKVVDGDTFHALIDLGFGITLEQRLRLRWLDAPEMTTGDGIKAKAVLEKALSITASEEMSKSPRAVMSTPVLIKTSKSDDQYGRYLVDVWVDGAEKTINQQLLDSGVFTVRGDE